MSTLKAMQENDSVPLLELGSDTEFVPSDANVLHHKNTKENNEPQSPSVLSYRKKRRKQCACRPTFYPVEENNANATAVTENKSPEKKLLKKDKINVWSKRKLNMRCKNDRAKLNGSDCWQCREIHCTRNEFMELDTDLINDLRDESSEKNVNQSRKLQDLVLNKDFQDCIDISPNKSPGELFLMIVEHALKYKSSLSEISDLFRLINIMFPRPILPDTRWILDNILNPKSRSEFHGICPKCCTYVGRIQDFKSFITCSVCSEIIDLNNPSSPNIFIIIDPTENIKLLIEENEKYYDYIVKERLFDGKIRDIFDGKYYRTFIRNLPANERYSYATTIFNTDGAPRFESSRYSIWPIYLQVNELPIQVRMKRIITCGMWFGKNKPEMTSFLQPFTETMIRLSTKGFKCTINNEMRLIKVYTLICCVDSQARAPVQGIKLFNGKYGCSWCLHDGEWYEGSMRYPILEFSPQQRTKTNMIEFMKRLTDENNPVEDVYGVQYVTPLINLPHFDIVHGIVPDYMHCCLAGVGKQITFNFLKCIPTSTVDKLNKFLLEIKVPHQLQRLTRSFEDIRDWKAKEWENFILYYSLPLFQLVLNRKMVQYWTLFVNSLYILLKCDISLDELNEADKDLHKFVFQTEELFSKKAMTYNVHQLLHIAESVMNWGPLWAHSSFPFESANHEVLQAIHCANGVNLQIVRYINMQHSVHTLRHYIYPHASPVVLNYCQEISVKRIRKSLKLSSVTYFGDGVLIDKKVAVKYGLSVKCTIIYQKAVKDGCLFTSSQKKNTRSDNSFALLSDDTFIKIIYFIVDQKHKKKLTLCNVVNTSTPVCNSINLIRSIGSEIIAVETDKIERICVFIKIENNCYIAVLPNSHNY
ncbi:uncharacterized protein [Temnothorax nylanderi]|uniref:uncharacterized protein isoform X1 n=1 Tax=Temnothorax nylanderi TaxID=102681 RepID=UPI003A84CACE